jgi:hypothetical protein
LRCVFIRDLLGSTDHESGQHARRPHHKS